MNSNRVSSPLFKSCIPHILSANFECCNTSNTIYTIGQRSLKTLSECIKATFFSTALTLGKVVVVTFLSSLLIATVAITALTSITLINRTYKLKENENPTLFHRMASLCFDIREVLLIALHYRTPFNKEILQKTDESEDSPQFILIQPSFVNDANPPIIYAPGYLDEPETLRTVCRELAEKTHSAIYIVKYRSRFQAIEEHTKDFGQVVKRALADTKKSDLIVVGHSMGGLVAGTYITDYKIAETHIKNWVTIASPLKGTKLAHLGWGKCVEQMKPSSPFMQAFNSKDKQQAMHAIPALHIYTKTDFIVPHKPFEENHSQMQEYMSSKPYGHLSLRSSPEVLEVIRQQLEA